MALTDAQIALAWIGTKDPVALGGNFKDSEHVRDFARAIESAACAERDARIAELERQLAEACKDAERLDYIQKNARKDPKMDGNHVWWPTALNSALKGPTLRQAIDNAMQKG